MILSDFSISQEFPDGASVEAALLRAKSGGAIDKALQNKAPGGYGLGGDAKFITSGSLNDYKDCGWYAWDEGVSNVPFAYGSCIILNKGGSWIAHQIAIAGYGQNICIRRYLTPTDTWDAWEWVNPPMKLGVEYRTTERYKGKPVYIKAVDTGALPNATFKSVAASFPNANAIVDYGGEAYQDGDHFIPLPCLKYGSDSYNNEKGVQVTLSNGFGITIATMTDFSSFTSSSVWVKYTKSTD